MITREKRMTLHSLTSEILNQGSPVTQAPPGLPPLRETEALAQWVALVAQAMLLSMGIFSYLQGHMLAAILDAVPLLMILIDQLAHLVGRRWPFSPSLIVLTLGLVQLILAAHISALTVIWAFPTLVGAILITRLSFANIYAAAMLVGGGAIAYRAWGIDLALSYLLALSGTWTFLFILMGVIQKLRMSSWRQSITDPLTGCYNRRYLDQYLSHAPNTGRAAMLLLDMDDFKYLNDKEGHAAGDNALRRMVRLLKVNWTSEAVCFRMGGDEFLVFVTLPAKAIAHMSDHEQDRNLTRTAQQITRVLNEDGGFSVSVGLAHFSWPCEIDDVFRHADSALYAAKRQGRGRLSIFETSQLPLHPDKSMSAKVEKASLVL